MSLVVQGTRIPDSTLAREITQFVHDTASPLLFHHSSRVYFFGALAGVRRGLAFDPELLYAGAMFHDLERAWADWNRENACESGGGCDSQTSGWI